MTNLQIEHYIVGPVQTNCYFLIHKDTHEMLVVDPGDSGQKLADRAKANGYHPKAILLTHGHFDHADGVEDFLASFPDQKIPVYAHEKEKETLSDPRRNLSGEMGFGGKSYHADVFVKDHETLNLAGFQIEVLFTPGHTAGGCCFYLPEEKSLFCGDTIFAGSIGRTDFLDGSLSTLVRSIKDQCFTLPDDTMLFPGHEGTSTIANEKRYNPFLQ